MKPGAFCFCLLLCLAGAAQGQSRAQLGSRDQIVIDQGRSYIFYRTNVAGANVRFLRERAPGEGAGAPAPYPDPRSWVQVEGGPRFTAGREGNSYLRAVEPGSYILYGNIGLGGNGSHVGICMCMGSLRFEAPAGRIVDLGEIVYPDLGASSRPWGVTLVPFHSGMNVPSRLAGLPLVPAEFHAAGKVPNYFGVEIDRHDPMPGVLAYRRDQPIDVRTGRDVPRSAD